MMAIENNRDFSVLHNNLECVGIWAKFQGTFTLPVIFLFLLSDHIPTRATMDLLNDNGSSLVGFFIKKKIIIQFF